jgi:hypothetical protein
MTTLSFTYGPRLMSEGLPDDLLGMEMLVVEGSVVLDEEVMG